MSHSTIRPQGIHLKINDILIKYKLNLSRDNFYKKILDQILFYDKIQVREYTQANQIIYDDILLNLVVKDFKSKNSQKIG